MKDFIKLIRIKHWIKNALIFLPLFFNKSIFQRDKFICSVVGFFAFCFVASMVYIINDICDCDRDRKHPTKCMRPIASGKVSKIKAVWIMVIFGLLALFLSSCISVKMGVFLLILYSLVNLAYSFGLKNIPILDVAILTSGFMLRIFYGAIITNIEVSSWLYLTIMSFAFYFGLGKRRNELLLQKDNKTRRVLQLYNKDFLDKSMNMCVTLGIVFYSLWAIEHVKSFMIWTVPLVIVIIMKYSLNIEGASDGDPVEVLFKDKVLIILGILYAVIILGLTYFIPGD